MKKKLPVATSLAVLLLLGVQGCGEKKAPESTSKVEAPASPILTAKTKMEKYNEEAVKLGFEDAWEMKMMSENGFNSMQDYVNAARKLGIETDKEKIIKARQELKFVDRNNSEAVLDAARKTADREWMALVALNMRKAGENSKSVDAWRDVIGANEEMFVVDKEKKRRVDNILTEDVLLIAKRIVGNSKYEEAVKTRSYKKGYEFCAPHNATVIDIGDVLLGQTSYTEIALDLKKTKVGCFAAGLWSVVTMGNETYAVFEGDHVFCKQKNEVDQLAAAKLISDRVYKVVGNYEWVSGDKIYLSDCKFNK